MKLTRHARNRLRWIARSHPEVTEERLLQELPGGETAGYDEEGNRRVLVSVAETDLTVVIDEERETVITVWIG